ADRCLAPGRPGRRRPPRHEPRRRGGHVGAQDLMVDRTYRAAFYAARAGTLGDWWTLLHPPYTAWHLSYVAVGAALAPQLSPSRLAVTLVAFFLAVGVAAHALDEYHGRPLGTAISDR